MRHPRLVAGLVALAAGLTLAAPAHAASVDALAKAECRQERSTDRADFRRDYDGTGKAAFRRCVADQKREARRDCREERREDAAEYRARYGSGSGAFTRCVKDELR
jgi:hypothetical protein